MINMMHLQGRDVQPGDVWEGRTITAIDAAQHTHPTLHKSWRTVYLNPVCTQQPVPCSLFDDDWYAIRR